MAAFVAVLLFQGLLLYCFWPAMDLPLWDESNYMGWGAKFAHGLGALTSVSNSPLYILVYSWLVRGLGATGAVFAMRLATTVLFSSALLAFLMRHLRSAGLAAFLAILWSSSGYNIGADWPVYKFGALLFLMALLHARSGQRPVTALLLALCALVRLEYLLVLVAYTGYLGAVVLRKRSLMVLGSGPKQIKDWPAIAMAVPALALLLYTAVHIESWSLGGPRTWFAFKQHYAFRQVESGRRGLEPWLDYQVVIDEDFPGCNSPMEALRTNPRAFRDHVARNLIQLPRVTCGLLLGVNRRGCWIVCALFLLLCLINAVRVVRGRRWRALAGNFKAYFREPADAVVLSFMAFAGLAPSLIVYAKNNYALLMLPAMLLCAGVVYEVLRRTALRSRPESGEDTPSPICEGQTARPTSPPSPAPGRLDRLLRWGPFALCVLTVPVVLLYPGLFSIPRRKPVYEKVMRLRDIWPDQPIRLLGVQSFSYANYLGWQRCTPIEPFGQSTAAARAQEKVTLGELVARHQPNAVLIAPRFLESSQFDSQSVDILDSSDWIKHEISADEAVYFRREGRSPVVHSLQP
ncbi:MAG: hypothetical protein JXR37_15120 [Kiritimatiellae bacterium]|nr:hypothetical protein [Kiritimatiellia bacterium]